MAHFPCHLFEAMGQCANAPIGGRCGCSELHLSRCSQEGNCLRTLPGVAPPSPWGRGFLLCLLCALLSAGNCVFLRLRPVVATSHAVFQMYDPPLRQPWFALHRTLPLLSLDDYAIYPAFCMHASAAAHYAPACEFAPELRELCAFSTKHSLHSPRRTCLRCTLLPGFPTSSSS